MANPFRTDVHLRKKMQRLIDTTRDLPTPFLTVDEPTLIRNIDGMQALCDAQGVHLRPHVKTHKTTTIAALQQARGAVGITVATLAEAEVFAAAGHRDILAVFPPVDRAKWQRYERLARTVHLTFAVDDVRGVEAVADLSARSGAVVGYFWEVDTGTGRAGTHPDATLRALTAARTAHPGAHYGGLMSFGGHLYNAPSITAVAEGAQRDSAILGRVYAQTQAVGSPPPAVSVGATPGAEALMSHPAVTELRAGNYVYNDTTQVALGAADSSDCALFIVGTVTGRPSAHYALIDAGSKAIPKEIMSTLTEGYGLVAGHPELAVTRLYEEVGVIEGTREALDKLHPNDRVAVIPNHSCSASVLYSRLHLVTTEGRMKIVPIDARDH